MALDFGNNMFGKFPIDETGAMQSDWKAIIEQGTRIIKNEQASNTTATIYTVPAGKVFYLYSANLAAYNVTTVNVTCSIDDASSNHIVFFVCAGDKLHLATTIAFSIPIKFTAAEIITVVNASVSGNSYGQITGYELNA